MYCTLSAEAVIVVDYNLLYIEDNIKQLQPIRTEIDYSTNLRSYSTPSISLSCLFSSRWV